jgi:hypothetical protein
MANDKKDVYRLQDKSSDWNQLFTTNAPAEVINSVITLVKEYGVNYDNEMIYKTIEALGYDIETIDNEETVTFLY